MAVGGVLCGQNPAAASLGVERLDCQGAGRKVPFGGAAVKRQAPAEVTRRREASGLDGGPGGIRKHLGGALGGDAGAAGGGEAQVVVGWPEDQRVGDRPR